MKDLVGLAEGCQKGCAIVLTARKRNKETKDFPLVSLEKKACPGP